jgi:ubiquinone/menaquinone biosynthesis C-methylase UbiE
MTFDWTRDADFLVCATCRASVAWSAADRAVCTACGAEYRVQDGILIAQRSFAGANDAAAKFYDGALWSRFKFWERLFFWLQGGEHRARRQYMKFLPAVAGQRIGITAVGAGNELEFIPVSCAVIGVDISIAQLRECAQRYGDRRVALILGEAERLPFADRCVDHSLSAGAFNFFRDPVGALRELVRITRPGGTVIVSDEIPRSRQAWQKRRFVRRFTQRLLGEQFSTVVFNRPETPMTQIFASAFSDWEMHSMWRGSGYCAVAQITEADHAALAGAQPQSGHR